MKKYFVLVLAAIILVASLNLTACCCIQLPGNNTDTLSRPDTGISITPEFPNFDSSISINTPSPASEADVINAFCEAGYQAEGYYVSVEELGLNEMGFDDSDLYTICCWQILRHNDYLADERITDGGELYYLGFNDSDDAERAYSFTLENSSEYYLYEENFGNLDRAYYNTVSPSYEYGKSIYLARQDNVLVLLVMEWDDYQDISVEYDFKHMQIMESLGF